jgi:hypothetical protein
VAASKAIVSLMGIAVEIPPYLGSSDGTVVLPVGGIVVFVAVAGLEVVVIDSGEHENNNKNNIKETRTQHTRFQFIK